MKIIIVGAGIGGLSAYLALRQHLSSLNDASQGPLQILLVEAHETPSAQSQYIGGGLGLAPNGIRAIESIAGQAAVKHIQEHAYPGSQMTFRNAKGKLLGMMSVGRGERYEYSMSMLPRAVVHDALLAEIDMADVRWGMKVVRVREEEEGDVVVEFSDGTKETADLVIGADGVRSVVKDGLFNGEFQAQYDGLLGLGGLLFLDALPVKFQESFKAYGVTMTFGKQGFFGYSMCSPLSHPRPFIQWWSIYETTTIPSRTNVDYEAIKNQLLVRHGDWKSPYDGPTPEDSTFRRIVELGCRPPSSDTQDANKTDDQISTTAMILPRYITPRLPYWSNATLAGTPEATRGRILLIGDAAHTMPPDVGQGVSCAAEDSVVYALLLKHYLSANEEQTKINPFVQAAKAYEEIRKPYIHRILDVAKRNGDMKKEMGWFAQKVRDLAMRLICRLPESMNDYIFGYDAEVAVEKYISTHLKG